MKKLLIAIGVVSLLAGVFTALSAKSNTLTTRNCYSNAVVKCGTFSQKELNDRITKSGKAAYKHYGVSTNLSGTKNGLLKANGDIVVNGKVVATGAQSVGRGAKSGATNVKIGGEIFHQHSARKAFLGYDTPVYVFFNADGTFKNAIAKICGNPIIAKPAPKPVYNCDSLVALKKSRTSFEVKIATTTKNGAKYKKVDFTVKNAKGKVVTTASTTGKSKMITVKTPGKYTVEAKVTFQIPYKASTKTVTKSDAKCKKSFTVSPEPVVNIKVCDLNTRQVITINEKKFDSKKHSKNLKDCEVAYTCTGTTVKTLSRTTREFATSYKLKNASHVKTSYVIRDSKGVVVQDSTQTRFTAKKAGTYTVQAIVSVKEKATGKVRTITAPNCKKSFTVSPEPVVNIKVCDLNTRQVITINEKKFDSKKHSKNLKDCEVAYTCTGTTVKTLSRTTREFATSYKLKNASHVKTSYVIRDSKGVVVQDSTQTRFTAKKAGTYTVQAIVSVKEKATGKVRTITAPNCKKSFTVSPEPVVKIWVCDLKSFTVIQINEKDFDSKKHSKNIKDCVAPVPESILVCELDTKKIISIDKKDFDSKKHSKNLDDCKEVVKQIDVCELDTKKVITINEKDFDSTKHSKNLDDCKEVVKTIEVCDLDTKKMITINEKDFDSTKHSKDATDCETAPVTPPETPEPPKELPTTGAGDLIAPGLGLGSLIAATSYYVASRRNLLSTFLGK